MSVFSDAMEAPGGVLEGLLALHGDLTGVDYTYSAQGGAGLAASTATDVDVIRVSSGDVGGGTRADQQPLVFYLKEADASRTPQRGDTIDDGTDVWSVVDVTHKPNAAIYKLTTQHLQTR